MFPTIIFIVLLIAFLISAIGFYKFIYFISVGYGLSISGIAMYLLLNYCNTMGIVPLIILLLLIIYGFRLSIYLLLREYKSVSYNKHMTKEIKSDKDVSIKEKIAIWIACAILYTCQTSPITYILNNNAQTNVLMIIGIFVMIIGISIESIADLQKSKSKKENPNTFCNKGLFKIVRCPNYLGEMIFWTGLFISCLKSITVYQLIIVLIGYLGIIYIMFSGARRLEIRQDRNYRNDKEYKKYIKKVPILLPLIPLYSVKKYKFLKG